MKIPTYCGNELDTDKMPDAQAELYEKAYELINLADKYRIPCFVGFKCKGLIHGGFSIKHEGNNEILEAGEFWKGQIV